MPILLRFKGSKSIDMVIFIVADPIADSMQNLHVRWIFTRFLVPVPSQIHAFPLRKIQRNFRANGNCSVFNFYRMRSIYADIECSKLLKKKNQLAFIWCRTTYHTVWNGVWICDKRMQFYKYHWKEANLLFSPTFRMALYFVISFFHMSIEKFLSSVDTTASLISIKINQHRNDGKQCEWELPSSY